MPSREKNKEGVRLNPAERRAFVLLKSVLNQVAQEIEIKDITTYPQTKHYAWRHWAKMFGRPPLPARQPSTAWAIFREDLPCDVLLKMQSNSMPAQPGQKSPCYRSPFYILNAWSWRLGQDDAARLFNIHNLSEYKKKVESLTFRQLRHFILLLPIMLIDTWEDPFNLSIEAFIEQEIRPNFRRYWREVGIPPNIILFPEARKEMEENTARRETFKRKWIGKTHGGFRENRGGFADRKDFPNILEFITRVHPLWKQIARFFALNDYDENCIEMVQATEKYKTLSVGIAVPHKLLKTVFMKIAHCYLKPHKVELPRRHESDQASPSPTKRLSALPNGNRLEAPGWISARLRGIAGSGESASGLA